MMLAKGLQVIAQARDAAAREPSFQVYELYVQGLSSLLMFSSHPEFKRFRSKVVCYTNEADKLKEALDEQAVDQSEEDDIGSDDSNVDAANWQSNCVFAASQTDVQHVPSAN